MNGKRPPAAIVLLSDGASTGKVDPVAAAQAARKLRIPIYTVALGTAQGTITVPRPGDAGGTETRRVPPDPQSLAEVAQGLGRQDLHRRRREQAQRRLQEPRLAPGHQEREAPDHRGLRRRRPRAAPARRRDVAALVRPPDLKKATLREPHDRFRRRRPHPAPRRAARRPRGGAVRDQARHRRPGRDARAPARQPPGRRPRAARGRARPGQDADREHARPGPGRHLHAHPVHARPRARRPRRHARLPPRHRALRHRARPGVRQLPARRRDQPRARPRSSRRCSRSCRSAR